MLKPTKTFIYALKAVVYMIAAGQPVLIRDIAEQEGISFAYLAKIVRRLVLGGVLKSKRGVGGGIALAKPPEEITLADVWEIITPSSAKGDCFFGEFPEWCGPDQKAEDCPVGKMWHRLEDQLREWMSQVNAKEIADYFNRHGKRVISSRSEFYGRTLVPAQSPKPRKKGQKGR
ncbi:MAG: Rrf2 family transcriptional regulator [Verrucomicrobia bacterium]|nr:Rrf2 family transcriptional regulator [Verrucomicrobiota bacterium]